MGKGKSLWLGIKDEVVNVTAKYMDGGCKEDNAPSEGFKLVCK